MLMLLGCVLCYFRDNFAASLYGDNGPAYRLHRARI
jgi:hypothetical protein